MELAHLLERRSFPEMIELENLIQEFGSVARHRVLDVIEFEGKEYPLHSLVIGPEDKSLPTLGMFGGVHGLEKIGSEVVLAWMRTILNLLRWDKSFQERLEKSRLVFFPIVNPVGIQIRRRSNANHVDLMRNSPLQAIGKTGMIYSGHRISKHLPFYQGPANIPMEKENLAIEKLLQEEFFPSQLSMAVDVHSGFGAVDRFWFPHAYCRDPFAYLPEVMAFKDLFDRTYPYHFYYIEPISSQYVLNGDVWDHFFLEHEKKKTGKIFIPWTLEIGSWLWLKKNPLQIFDPIGPWHPIRPHRRHRILRRHLTLFDFLHRATGQHEVWSKMNGQEREGKRQEALRKWYGH